MLSFLLFACDPAEEDTADPGVLSMLEAVNLDAPTDDGDATPERANTDSAEGDEYDTGYLRGWVKSTIEQVFTALSTPDVGVDRREMDSWSSIDIEVEGIDAAYVVNNAPAAMVTEDFDLTWRHEYVNEGSGMASAWEKTDGTLFVPLLEGSAVASVSGDAVDLSIVYHLGTVDSTPEDAVRYLEDFYASILAAAHGEDLPTYE